MNKCKFCEREIKNKGSLVAHEMCCINNPDKIRHYKSPDGHAKKGSPNHRKGKKFTRLKFWDEKYPIETVLTDNSTYPRHCLKKRILDGKLLVYECEICGIEPVWNGKPMVLILDHINGKNNDNRLENLRFVCSNCDCQLPTYKSKNRNYKV